VTDPSATQVGVSLAIEANRLRMLSDATLQSVLDYYSATAEHDPPDVVLRRVGRLNDEQVRRVMEVCRGLVQLPPDRSKPGRPFGSRLTLYERLGSGAMGTVYRAYDSVLRRDVAVKVMKVPEADESVRKLRTQRFQREAQVMARIQHPAIVGVYDAGVQVTGEDEEFYLVMELVSGKSLSELIRTNQRMEVAGVARVGLAIAQGLEACHAAGVIHRDVKPANVLVNAAGNARLTDFGVAHDDDHSATKLTMENGAIGTLAYMSPEQLCGRPADARTDIYALGVTLHEALTGMTLFGGQNAVVLMKQIMEDEPERVSKTRSDCPAALEAVILKCLAKSPANRYVTAADLARDLEGVLAGVQTRTDPRTRTRRRRSPWPMTTALVALAGVLALAIAAASRWLPGTEQSAQDTATTAIPGSVSAPEVPVPASVAPPPAPVPTMEVVSVTGEGRAVTTRGGVELVWVPAGVGILGAPVGLRRTKLEPPQRPVRFDRGFWIGRLEVTRAEYARYCSATAATMPDERIKVGRTEYPLRDDEPVVSVSHEEAAAFCRWAGGRLPTADEWEYAARGSDGRPWPWGVDWPKEGLVANIRDATYGHALGEEKPTDPITWEVVDGFVGLSAAGSFPLGASPFGCLDMIGNAHEWLTGEDDEKRPLALGGCWTFPVWGARPWLRMGLADARYTGAGMRLVVDGDEPGGGPR
jgi:formylglycine-generating enzyme required for sulfatase activity/tRNA A-37 threonylcarbamoyl transferase component Bud32